MFTEADYSKEISIAFVPV